MGILGYAAMFEQFTPTDLLRAVLSVFVSSSGLWLSPRDIRSKKEHDEHISV